MAKLFIIGNGFDLAHGMKTRYSDFRDYLVEKYEIEEYLIDTDGYEIPTPYDLPKGGEEYDDTIASAAIIKTLDNKEGNEWKDVEKSLGELDFGEFLDDWAYNFESEDDNVFRDNMYRNEDNARNLCGALRLIEDYFHDWVKTIKVSNIIIPAFNELISPKKDLFLNFNYTKTLEKLYNAQNVCHIHGTQNEGIYFGHGNDEDKTDYYQSNWFGAELELNQLQYSLRKNTDEAYIKNAQFFKKIEEAANKGDFAIYSFGFSFSEVDTIYLRKIFRRIDTKDVIFHLNDFESKEKQAEYISVLNDCGFKGEIHRSFK